MAGKAGARRLPQPRRAAEGARQAVLALRGVGEARRVAERPERAEELARLLRAWRAECSLRANEWRRRAQRAELPRRAHVAGKRAAAIREGPRGAAHRVRVVPGAESPGRARKNRLGGAGGTVESPGAPGAGSSHAGRRALEARRAPRALRAVHVRSLPRERARRAQHRVLRPGRAEVSRRAGVAGDHDRAHSAGVGKQSGVCRKPCEARSRGSARHLGKERAREARRVAQDSIQREGAHVRPKGPLARSGRRHCRALRAVEALAAAARRQSQPRAAAVHAAGARQALANGGRASAVQECPCRARELRCKRRVPGAVVARRAHVREHRAEQAEAPGQARLAGSTRREVLERARRAGLRDGGPHRARVALRAGQHRRGRAAGAVHAGRAEHGRDARSGSRAGHSRRAVHAG
mmetsp:Transcript_3860/g.15977  ORF Transcript_3860/g.15977 Transcript_3860/m.15977 type:complete len:410 (-) Transcript_3860:8957-10186(-)